MSDLFDAPVRNAALQLEPVRKLVALMKTDNSIYEACPEPVRKMIGDILMPPATDFDKALAQRDEVIADLGRTMHKITDMHVAAQREIHRLSLLLREREARDART